MVVAFIVILMAEVCLIFAVLVTLRLLQSTRFLISGLRQSYSPHGSCNFSEHFVNPKLYAKALHLNCFSYGLSAASQIGANGLELTVPGAEICKTDS